MDIEFENLSFEVGRQWFYPKGSGRTLLKSVSGRFRAGELSGILGPSGAGKTCLLNALSGYRSNGVRGELRVNGQPRDEGKFRKMSCYITQEDLLVPMLSLNEVMVFAASLKLPRSYSGKQKKSVVEEVQIMLGLSECKHTRTEALSGGQKKRLSIALELINNPPVLFLDEPTSGLDNVSTSNLLHLLRHLARQGRTIVCTIHQPSASLFNLFDHVYVLSAGVCVYQGATTELIPFLDREGLKCPTHYNPADYIIELTDGDDESNILKLSKATKNGKTSCFKRPSSIVNSQMGMKDSGMKGAASLLSYGRLNDDVRKASGCGELSASFWFQFYTLLSRMFLQIKRNKLGLKIQLFHHLGCGLAVAVVFFQLARDADQFFNHMKFCMGVIMFHAYTHVMVPILSFPLEVKLVKKEHFNQWYNLFPYYMALTFSKVPTITGFSMLFLTISYFTSGLPIELYRFITFCVVCIMVSFVAEGMGLAIGSVFSITNGTAVGPLSIAPFLGLAIYGFDFAREIPFYMQPLVKLSFMRSGVTALVITVFGLDRGRLECWSSSDYCHFQDPKVTLHYLNLEGASPWTEIAALVAMLIFFRAATYLGLKWRLRT